jgi:hypothetical protein
MVKNSGWQWAKKADEVEESVLKLEALSKKLEASLAHSGLFSQQQ